MNDDIPSLVCDKCGHDVELITPNSDGFKCTCPECAITWNCDKEGNKIGDEQMATPEDGCNKTIGKRFCIAVLASKTRNNLNKLTEVWDSEDSQAVGNQINKGVLDRASRGRSMPTTMGKGSEVTTSHIKSAAQAYRMLQEPYTVGLVIQYEGDGIGRGMNNQVLAIYKRSTYPSMVDVEPNADLIGKMVPNGMRFASMRLNQVYSVISKIFKNGAAQGFDVFAKVIGKDFDRADKQKQRQAARQGSPFFPGGRNKPINPSSKEFRKAVFGSLYDRLAKFKASKADITTPENFLSLVKTKGFIDVVIINGVEYRRRDARIDIDNLKKYTAGTDFDEGWHGNSVRVEYDAKLDFSKYTDRESFESVPKSFAVYLKFDGANIVPHRVVASKTGSYSSPDGTEEIYRESRARKILAKIVVN